MNWPMSHEFNEAIQNANLVFSDPDLRSGEAVVGARGLPLPRSGNFADVYQLRGADGRDWAVKCFTRPVTGLGDRYAAISKSLTQAGLPFTVGFKYLAEGIRVGGAWWPVVKMEWVEGLLLNQVIRENAGRPTILAALGQMWVKLCRRLRDTRVAHADLQHGNVLMVPGTRAGAYGLKLIDYDGMYVPALANQPSGESGHPAYQHPSRSATAGYSPDVDRFPHLLIATALKGMEVVGTSLWERYDTGDNLLFVESDFKDPAASKLMRELWLTEHPGVQSLVGRLAISARRPIPQTPWLDQIAPDGEPVDLNDTTRREAMRALGMSAPVVIPLPPEPEAPPPPPKATARQPVLALPPEPAPTLVTQLRHPQSVPAHEVDVELFALPTEEISPKRKKFQKGGAEEGESRKSSKLMFVIGGVLLLVGGVVAAVTLGGGKDKPQQTAENTADKPTNPPPNETKSKEKGGDPPRTKTPDTVTPTPKDKTPDPITPAPKITPVPAEVSIKEKKKVILSGGAASRGAEFDNDGRSVVFHSQDNFLTVYDPLTWVGRQFVELPKSNVPTPACWHPLPEDRVVVWPQDQKEAVLFDLRTGKPAGNIPIPEMPATTERNIGASLRVSPDGRFVAIGRLSMYVRQVGGEAGYRSVPLRVFDTKTGKAVVAFDWTSGSIFFTPDSARVLVIDAYAHGRWFKLPGGEPDGEWKFAGDVTSGMSPMRAESASRDGRVLLCRGMVNERHGYFVMETRTGKVSVFFGDNFYQNSGRISANGRVAIAVERAVNTGLSHLVEFDVAQGSEVARIKLPAGSANQYRPVLSPDGRTAIVIGFLSGSEGALVFDLARIPGDDGTIPKEQPRPPSEPIELKQRWAAPIAIYPSRRVDADPATNLLVLGSDEGIAVLDLKTGLPKKEFASLTATKAHGLFLLDKERFATLTNNRDDFEIWESRTGKLGERLTVPSIPAGPANASDRYITLSPNQKYIAIGRVGVPTTEYPETPFRVVEAATRKLLFETQWHGGSAYFTADSSRVLVAEWTGRMRWFKLPSGTEDGGWDFGPSQERRINTVLGISADGSKVAYYGPGLLKPGSAQVGVIDGKTGKPVLSVPKGYLDNFAALSADGRRAAFIRFPPDGMEVEWRIDVFDVPSCEMFAYVRFVASRSNPMFGFTPDGKELVVHDCNGVKAKAYLFDIIEPGTAEIGIKDPAPEVIEVEIAPGVRMKMCWIPPGEAQLGSLEAERDEVKKLKGGAEVNWDKNESEEIRGKFKTKGFWMGKYEVTQNEWKAVMGKNPSDFVPGQEAVAKAGILDTGRFPVEKVSWDDSHEFLKKLNATVKLPAKMGTGKFALPDEDQWEYAARGGKGNKQAFYFGDVLSLKSANCFAPFDGTISFPRLRPTVVGSYEKAAPHPWGLCDIAGNVFEWCENAYRPGDSARVIRGGSWGDPGWNARSANRVRWDHDRRESNVGLRVCFFPE